MYKQVNISKDSRSRGGVHHVAQKKRIVKQNHVSVNNENITKENTHAQIVDNNQKALQPIYSNRSKFKTYSDKSVMQKVKTKAKPKTLEEALKIEYASSQAHATAEDLGSGPTSNDFIVRGGQTASNHHIYPKSKLKKFARNLSRMQVAIYTLQTKNLISNASAPYDFNSDEKSKVPLLFRNAKAIASKYGMEEDGSQTLMGANYYWLPGNLFVGINSGYRTDDPGDSEERKSPKTMNPTDFQKAIDWGRSTSSLADSLGDISEGFQNKYTDKLNANLNQKDSLAKGMKITSQEVGEDWALDSATTAHRYLERWGFAGKQYKLNTTGTNDFKRLENNRKILAEAITRSIRSKFTVDDMEEFKNATAGHISLQRLVPAHRRGSSSELKDPNMALSLLDDIVYYLKEISVNLPEGKKEKYRKILKELRDDNDKYKSFI